MILMESESLGENKTTSFIDSIHERESCVPNTIEDLKSQELPLLFYGAGILASHLYNVLSENSVAITDIVVDEKYYQANAYFEKRKIKKIKNTLNEYGTVNIFLAFSAKHLNLVKQSLLDTGKVNKIYYFDPAIFNGNESYSYSDIIDNMTEYELLCSQLHDDLSRRIMVNFINQRICEKIGYLDDLWSEDDYNPEGIFEYQYDEVFVDCGAYDGDTIKSFVINIKISGGGYKCLIAFEPDQQNFAKLQNLQCDIKRLRCINKGVWSKKAELRFNNCGMQNSAISKDGDLLISVDSIDNVLEGEKASYIKMDIEGAELQALMGAKETITRYKPKLAICVYHKKDDLLTIPQYIKSLVPEYKLYIRAHRPYTQELVLYATV